MRVVDIKDGEEVLSVRMDGAGVGGEGVVGIAFRMGECRLVTRHGRRRKTVGKEKIDAIR